MSCGGFLTWNAVEQAVCGGTVMNEDRWIEHHQPIHLGVVSRSPHGPAGAVATLATVSPCPSLDTRGITTDLAMTGGESDGSAAMDAAAWAEDSGGAHVRTDARGGWLVADSVSGHAGC